MVLLVAEGGGGIDLFPIVLVLDGYQLLACLLGDLGEPLQVVRQIHHTGAYRPHDRAGECLQRSQARIEGEVQYRLEELLMQVDAGVNRRSDEYLTVLLPPELRTDFHQHLDQLRMTLPALVDEFCEVLQLSALAVIGGGFQQLIDPLFLHRLGLGAAANVLQRLIDGVFDFRVPVNRPHIALHRFDAPVDVFDIPDAVDLCVLGGLPRLADP